MELNHHIMAKEATDSILAKFKNGEWVCCKDLGKDFYRTNTFADFPAPDASFADEEHKVIVSFEFKPPTETKRGILTGLGQSIAYLRRSNVSYLVVPNVLDGYPLGKYLKELFSSYLAGKVAVGLITYSPDDASSVKLEINVDSFEEKSIPLKKSSDNRYWAKHQDLPLPLFYLILHYFYKKKNGEITGDAYAECWKNHMACNSIIENLEIKPVTDLQREPIKTMTSDKYVMYNKGILDTLKTKYKQDKCAIAEGLKLAIATEKPKNFKGTWDNNYKKVRRYLMAFFKQLNMIDSNYEITERGMKLHQIGMINGASSKLFKDYFTKEVLTTGCHFDLLIDFDRMYRAKAPETTFSKFLEDMELNYEKRGYIKRNPGRKADDDNNKPFLQHERTLWRYLDLVDDNYVVDWKRIIEVCSLPEM